MLKLADVALHLGDYGTFSDRPSGPRSFTAPTVRHLFQGRKMKSALAMLGVILVFGCSSHSSDNSSGKLQDKSKGFFGKAIDQITERECNVAKFTCPYGLGPADEPCECTDPSGRVWQGRTVK